MKLIDHLRSPLKHSNPERRKVAVKEVTDVTQLCAIMESDPDSGVRATAFAQIVDPDVLLLLAKGNGEFSVPAVERLSDPRQLANVAQHAAGPAARIAAVAKITDPLVLQQVYAYDLDPAVRRAARRQHSAPDRTREFLKVALADMEIAERGSAGSAEFGGSLEDVCSNLLADPRFEVHGFVMDSGQGGGPEQLPHAAETIAPFSYAQRMPRRQYVELLGGPRLTDEPQTTSTESKFYRIKIWRRSVNEYEWTLEERRVAMTRDLEKWSKSSRSDEGTASSSE